jgi:hypothetical protein
MLMSSRHTAATLHYQPNGFRVIRPGDHVICAVSAEEIPLEALRYWSVAWQEAYASPDFATRRLLGQDLGQV